MGRQEIINHSKIGKIKGTISRNKNMRKTGDLAIGGTLAKSLPVVEITVLPACFGLFIIVNINLQIAEGLSKLKQKTGNTVPVAEKSNLKNIGTHKVIVPLRCRF